jgi:hypothetical protein
VTKPIFNPGLTDYLVMPYDIALLDEPGFGDKLDEVLERIKGETENGERVFDYIEQDAGQVLLKFRQYTPVRVIVIWSNRIEKMMQELCAALNAA